MFKDAGSVSPFSAPSDDHFIRPIYEQQAISLAMRHARQMFSGRKTKFARRE